MQGPGGGVGGVPGGGGGGGPARYMPTPTYVEYDASGLLEVTYNQQYDSTLTVHDISSFTVRLVNNSASSADPSNNTTDYVFDTSNVTSYTDGTGKKFIKKIVSVRYYHNITYIVSIIATYTDSSGTTITSSAPYLTNSYNAYNTTARTLSPSLTYRDTSYVSGTGRFSLSYAQEIVHFLQPNNIPDEGSVARISVKVSDVTIGAPQPPIVFNDTRIKPTVSLNATDGKYYAKVTLDISAGLQVGSTYFIEHVTYYRDGLTLQSTLTTNALTDQPPSLIIPTQNYLITSPITKLMGDTPLYSGTGADAFSLSEKNTRSSAYFNYFGLPGYSTLGDVVAAIKAKNPIASSPLNVILLWVYTDMNSDAGITEVLPLVQAMEKIYSYVKGNLIVQGALQLPDDVNYVPREYFRDSVITSFAIPAARRASIYIDKDSLPIGCDLGYVPIPYLTNAQVRVIIPNESFAGGVQQKLLENIYLTRSVSVEKIDATSAINIAVNSSPVPSPYFLKNSNLTSFNVADDVLYSLRFGGRSFPNGCTFTFAVPYLTNAVHTVSVAGSDTWGSNSRSLLEISTEDFPTFTVTKIDPNAPFAFREDVREVRSTILRNSNVMSIEPFVYSIYFEKDTLPPGCVLKACSLRLVDYTCDVVIPEDGASFNAGTQRDIMEEVYATRPCIIKDRGNATDTIRLRPLAAWGGNPSIPDNYFWKNSNIKRIMVPLDLQKALIVGANALPPDCEIGSYSDSTGYQGFIRGTLTDLYFDNVMLSCKIPNYPFNAADLETLAFNYAAQKPTRVQFKPIDATKPISLKSSLPDYAPFNYSDLASIDVPADIRDTVRIGIDSLPQGCALGRVTIQDYVNNVEGDVVIYDRLVGGTLYEILKSSTAPISVYKINGSKPITPKQGVTEIPSNTFLKNTNLPEIVIYNPKTFVLGTDSLPIGCRLCFFPEDYISDNVLLIYTIPQGGFIGGTVMAVVSTTGIPISAFVVVDNSRITPKQGVTEIPSNTFLKNTNLPELVVSNADNFILGTNSLPAGCRLTYIPGGYVRNAQITYTIPQEGFTGGTVANIVGNRLETVNAQYPIDLDIYNVTEFPENGFLRNCTVDKPLRIPYGYNGRAITFKPNSLPRNCVIKYSGSVNFNSPYPPPFDQETLYYIQDYNPTKRAGTAVMIYNDSIAQEIITLYSGIFYKNYSTVAEFVWVPVAANSPITFAPTLRYIPNHTKFSRIDKYIIPNVPISLGGQFSLPVDDPYNPRPAVVVLEYCGITYDISRLRPAYTTIPTNLSGVVRILQNPYITGLHPDFATYVDGTGSPKISTLVLPGIDEFVFSRASMPENQIYEYTGVRWRNSRTSDYETISEVTSDAVNVKLVYGTMGLRPNMLMNATTVQSVSIINSGNVSEFDVPVNAFKGCTALTTVNFKPRIIEDEAFSGCISLNTINLSSVTALRNAAFYNCTTLKTVNLTNVSRIMQGAFGGCTGLTTVVIRSAGAFVIDANAFIGCTSLTSVDIQPTTSLIINDSIFSGCTSLATLTLSGLTVIDDTLIGTLPAIKTMNITLTSTGTCGTNFTSIPSIESVTISKAGVLQLQDNIFSDCAHLKSLTMNCQVAGQLTYTSSTSAYAFKNCSALESLTLQFAAGSGSVFAVPLDNMVALRTVILSGDVTVSSPQFLAGSTNVKKLTVNGVFTGAVNYPMTLEELVIDNRGVSNEVIPSYAFFERTNLKSVTFMNTIKAIGGGCILRLHEDYILCI